MSKGAGAFLCNRVKKEPSQPTSSGTYMLHRGQSFLSAIFTTLAREEIASKLQTRRVYMRVTGGVETEKMVCETKNGKKDLVSERNARRLFTYQSNDLFWLIWRRILYMYTDKGPYHKFAVRWQTKLI